MAAAGQLRTINSSDDLDRFWRADNRLSESGVTPHFVNGTRSSVRRNAKDLADVVAGLFCVSGVAGAVVTGLVIAAHVAVLSATLASLITPIGWAAVGVAGVALIILAYRHFALTHANFETRTCVVFGRAMGMGVIAYALSVVIAVIVIGIVACAKEGRGEGGGCSGCFGGGRFWDGFVLGMWIYSPPLVTGEEIPIERNPEVGEKSADNRHLWVFKGDQIRTTGTASATLIPKA